MKYLHFFLQVLRCKSCFYIQDMWDHSIQTSQAKTQLNGNEKAWKKNIHWKKSLEKKAGFQVLKSMTWVLESTIINDFNRFRQKRLIVFDPSTYSTYYTVALFSKRPPENQMTAEI